MGDSGEAKSLNMQKILAQNAIKQVFTSNNTPVLKKGVKSSEIRPTVADIAI